MSISYRKNCLAFGTEPKPGLFSAAARFLSVCILAVLPSTLIAQSSEWLTKADAVELRSKELMEFVWAHELGNVADRLARPDPKEMRCLVAGELLGFEDHVQSFAIGEEPPMDIEMDIWALSDIKTHSGFLDGWVQAAREIAPMELNTVATVWNLDCRGKMGIPDNVVARAEDYSAAFRQDGGFLYIQGDIEKGFFERFQIWLMDHPETKTVVVGSGGGYVIDAMKAGRLIRSEALETTSGAQNCTSACTFVFMAGKKRTIWNPWPKLGFHRLSVNGKDIPIDHPVYGAIRDYASEMGVDADMVIQFMDGSPPTSFFEPEWEDLCRSAVATFVQRGCSAEEFEE